MPRLSSFSRNLANIGTGGGGGGGLFSFTSFMFSNAGSTGYTGPTLSNCLANYNTSTYTWLNDTSFFNVVTQGFQVWTAPRTATYRIDAAGAKGGRNINLSTTYEGGYGARVVTDVALIQGQKLVIVVGQSGTDYNSTAFPSGGGGGGSFVWDNTTNNYVVAAGGGGAGAAATPSLIGTRTLADGKANITNGTSITDGGGFVSSGGTGGNGGGISGRNILYGGPGAGVVSNGQGGTAPGLTRANGWLGGSSANPAGANGGFGGGGGSYGDASYSAYCWPGGGGGYSGGACGHNGGLSDGQWGGGGGSYSTGSVVTLTDGYNNAMGYVTITAL